ncbi:hypothetical protein [Rhizobium sp. HT1-10]|uniref:hypothetical protein n=1 Tax=Rhizobium sp. HT1-10 TaxID=3111638 RepID=UPI003C18F703
MAKGQKTGGRQRGTPNKLSGNLREAILAAADKAGEGDIVEYLTGQAKNNGPAFLSLLGKLVPTQITGDAENPIYTITRIELVAPPMKDGRVDV